MRAGYWIWAPVLLIVSGFFLFSLWSLDRTLEKQADQAADSRLELMEILVTRTGGLDTPAGFERWCAPMAERLDLRISYIVDNREWAVCDATDGTGPMSDAWKVLDAGLGRPGGILRVEAPWPPAHDTARWALGAGAVLSLALAVGALLASLYSGRLLKRSVHRFTSIAGSVGRGRFEGAERRAIQDEFKPLASAMSDMARQIGGHIEFLEDQKLETWALLDGMSEGVAVLGPDGRVRSYNHALSEIFPGAGELTGRRPLEVFLDPDLQRAVNSMLSEPGEHGATRLEMTVGGSQYEVTAAPYSNQNGLRRIAIVLHDISDRKRMERILRDFVANVSHQLRTPLTSITGYAETLVHTPPEDEGVRRQFLTAIARNSERMSRTVACMLALARSEQAEGAGDLAPLDIGEAVAHAVEETEAQADRGVRVVYAGADGPLYAMAQMEGLNQALTNVLENAVRHSPAGGEVRVEAGRNGDGVVVRVSDQGPGIAMADRERIFERFYQGRGREAGNEGLGLGLAIARTILRNFGGDVVLTPTSPGATFELRIPAADCGIGPDAN